MVLVGRRRVQGHRQVRYRLPISRAFRAAGRGQGLVEFALVLPILLLLLLGIIELGRMFTTLAEATSASREAARYGASVGDTNLGGPRFLDCVGMRAAARRMLSLSTVTDNDIAISWDSGQGTPILGTCDSPPSRVEVLLGDRVVVAVTLTYTPIVPLVPIPPMPIRSETARTILMDIAAGPTATLGGPLSTNTPEPPTLTPTTEPPTITPGGPTLTPTETPTETPYYTPTITNTPRPTATPVPAPTNFQVSVNCTNGAVRFSWNAVPGAHYYGVYEAMTPPPDIQVCLTNKTRCDYASIRQDGVVHTYYVVAYVYTTASQPSNVGSAMCPAP